MCADNVLTLEHAKDLAQISASSHSDAALGKHTKKHTESIMGTCAKNALKRAGYYSACRGAQTTEIGNRAGSVRAPTSKLPE